MIGYRYIDNFYSTKNPEIGDVLPNSYVWDSDEPTDEELPGTCCFGDLAALKEYAKWSKRCGVLVVVDGNYEQHGDLSSEILLSNANVLEVIEW